MVDGTYEFKVDVPVLGTKTGQLVLDTTGGGLDGKIVALGKEHPISSGSANGDSFEIAGMMKIFPIGKVEYECTGTVEGNTLTCVAKAKERRMKLKGNRK